MDNTTATLAVPRTLKEAATESVEDDAFTLALKAEIQKVLDQPLSPATLGTMSKILDATAEILMARNPDYALLGGRRRSRMMGGIGEFEPVAYAPSSMNETFGAKAIRELVALVPQALASYRPESMVRAIVEARRAGDKELAKRLEATLVGAPDAKEQPATEQPQAAE